VKDDDKTKDQLRDNSQQAYHHAKKNEPPRRLLYYQFAVTRGATGVTDDEVMANTPINHKEIVRLRKNLIALDALQPTGTNRMTRSKRQAAVWVAVPGVDVTKPIPEDARKKLLQRARDLLKSMTDNELREFLGDDPIEEHAPVVEPEKTPELPDDDDVDSILAFLDD